MSEHMTIIAGISLMNLSALYKILTKYKNVKINVNI